MAAGAEEERHDVDPRRAGGGEAPRRLAEVGAISSRKARRDRRAGRGGADARGDRLEGLGPARVARAVGEQDDGARHRRHR